MVANMPDLAGGLASDSMPVTQASKPPEPVSVREPRRRVLIADDEPDTRYLLRAVFEAHGWEVLEAEDGQQAFERIIDEEPDLAVLDNRMPARTGADVYQQLRRGAIGLPIILMTAASRASELAVQLGLRYFLPKPFGIDDVLSVVARAVGDAERPGKLPALPGCGMQAATLLAASMAMHRFRSILWAASALIPLGIALLSGSPAKAQPAPDRAAGSSSARPPPPGVMLPVDQPAPAQSAPAPAQAAPAPAQAAPPPPPVYSPQPYRDPPPYYEPQPPPYYEPMPPMIPRGYHRHDGFFLRMTLGPSLVSARMNGGDAHVGGLGIASSLAVGGTPVPGLVFAGELLGTNVTDSSMSGPRLITNKVGYVGISAVQLLVDLYPSPARGFHVLAGSGFATALLGRTSYQDDSYTRTLNGMNFDVGVGWEGWIGADWSMGAIFRLDMGSLRGGGETMTYAAPTLLFDLTYH